VTLVCADAAPATAPSTASAMSDFFIVIPESLSFTDAVRLSFACANSSRRPRWSAAGAGFLHLRGVEDRWKSECGL
ncbi:hypothetical protein RY831_28755, partial [Noviherbaspirillum sp. CPCC 100848]